MTDLLKIVELIPRYRNYKNHFRYYLDFKAKALWIFPPLFDKLFLFVIKIAFLIIFSIRLLFMSQSVPMCEVKESNKMLHK
jgi:hypothetical protein